MKIELERDKMNQITQLVTEDFATDSVFSVNNEEFTSREARADILKQRIRSLFCMRKPSDLPIQGIDFTPSI